MNVRTGLFAAVTVLFGLAMLAGGHERPATIPFSDPDVPAAIELPLPDCTKGDHLTWTNGVGFGCANPSTARNTNFVIDNVQGCSIVGGTIAVVQHRDGQRTYSCMVLAPSSQS